MIKKKIPLIETRVWVYHGADEWPGYLKTIERHGADVDGEKDDAPITGGRTFAGWVWVADLKDRNTVLHELSHLCDNTMMKVGSDDGEFRAYISAWLMDAILKEDK